MNRKKIPFVILFLFFIILVNNFLLDDDRREEGREGKRVQILFTNDLHSSADYPELARHVAQERADAAARGVPTFLLDAGDIAMGTTFHTLYSTSAFEHNVMSIIGYDAITPGNHDFDFGARAFLEMLSARAPYLSDTTAFLLANIDFSTSQESRLLHQKTRPYKIVERGGVKVGLIGVMGENSFSCIASADSLLFRPPYKIVDSLVRVIRESEDPDIVVVISHGGTMGKSAAKSDDGKLARRASGVDLIVSGHDHDALYTPLIVNSVPIVSAGSKGRFLGKIELSSDSIFSYRLIDLTEPSESASDGEVCDGEVCCGGVCCGGVCDTLVEAVKEYVELSRASVAELFRHYHNVEIYDTVAFLERGYELPVAKNGTFYFESDSVQLPLSDSAMNNLPLGKLVAESYRAAASKFAPISGGDYIAVVPFGVIRAGVAGGYVTYEKLFNALSLGRTLEGGFGYPLVSAFLTGDELEDLCELNASVASSMPDARLYFAALEYECGRFRLPFTRVKALYHNGVPIEKSKLYSVVTDLYTVQLIGLLKSSSFGLLSASAKDENGVVVTDLKSRALPVTQWQALADYLYR